MSTLLAALAALGFAVASFALLALAMARHSEQVIDQADTTVGFRVGLRSAAVLLAAAALACCWQPWDAAVAVLVWLGLLSCAAVLTGLVLSYAPTRLIPVAATASVLALALTVYELAR